MRLLTLDELISRVKENHLVTSVHSKRGVYTVAIGRNLVLLSRSEIKWFFTGLLIGANKYDL